MLLPSIPLDYKKGKKLYFFNILLVASSISQLEEREHQSIIHHVPNITLVSFFSFLFILHIGCKLPRLDEMNVLSKECLIREHHYSEFLSQNVRLGFILFDLLYFINLFIYIFTISNH